LFFLKKIVFFFFFLKKNVYLFEIAFPKISFQNLQNFSAHQPNSPYDYRGMKFIPHPKQKKDSSFFLGGGGEGRGMFFFE
jgi:hypothetical protein